MTSLGTRLAYGTGGAVYAVKEAAYTQFILLFYTQVLGLNGTVTGVVIALSLLWDAVSDPLVGTLSDRLRSPLGRRHPFMYASIVPMGLGFVGLFWPPAWVLGDSLLLSVWLLFWSLWVRTFITTYSIPNLALSTDITSDYQDRSQVLGMRLSFTFLFSVLMPAVALLLIFAPEAGEDGRFLSDNYIVYGALSCAVCWAMGSISSVGTRRFILPSTDRDRMPDSRAAGNTLTRDLLRTMKNKTFRYLVGFEVAIMIAFGSVSTLNIMVWTYYWEFEAQEVSLILAAPSLLAVALVLVSLKPLGRWFEKYQIMQFSTVGMILNCLWLYPAHLLGLIPDLKSLFLGLNFLFMLIFMYCFLMRTVQLQSITADVTDEHEWDHGVRQEGGFFAAVNFAGKVATVAGPLYGGFALDLVGLTAGMRPGEVPQSVLNGLVIAYGFGTIPAMVLGLLFALRINLGRARVADLQRMIRERAGNNLATNADL